MKPEETGGIKNDDSSATRLGGKPGIFRPDVKPPVERGRFRQGCIAPAGRGLDGFCSATTLTASGRKMLLAVGAADGFPYPLWGWRCGKGETSP